MSSRILHASKQIYAPYLWQHGAQPGAESRQACLIGRDGGDSRDSATGRDSPQQELQAREDERARTFEHGRQAGLDAGRQEIHPHLERLAHSVDELSTCRARYRKEVEREVVMLALEVARRILRRELSVDPQAVLGLVSAALATVNLREVIEIRTHPSHSEIVTRYLQSIGGPDAIKITADGHLEPGAVTVETRRGGFDASAESQLQEIGRGFADLLERNGR